MSGYWRVGGGVWVLALLLGAALSGCSSSGSDGSGPSQGGQAGSPTGTGGVGAGLSNGGAAAAGAVTVPATTGIVDRSCTAGAIRTSPSEGNISEPDRTTGSNGTFVNACAADGTLTEYVCESNFTCNDQCMYMDSGQVTPTMVHCGAGCSNGACKSD